jgi:hypothetical protein
MVAANVLSALGSPAPSSTMCCDRARGSCGRTSPRGKAASAVRPIEGRR